MIYIKTGKNKYRRISSRYGRDFDLIVFTICGCALTLLFFRMIGWI